MTKNTTTATNNKAGIKSIDIRDSIILLPQICDYCIFPFMIAPIRAKSNKQHKRAIISLLYFLIKRIVLV